MITWDAWSVSPPLEAQGLRVAVHEFLPRPVLHDDDARGLEVGGQIGGELGALRVGDGNEVLDAERVAHLSADSARHEPDAQPLAGAVDRGGRSGRTSSDNGEVEFTRDIFRPHRLRDAQARLQDLEKTCKIALAHMHQLVAGEHGGDALDAQPFDLFGRERAVPHLVLEVVVHEGEEVQGLDHVGAIGAFEAREGAQAHGAAQVADARERSFVGKLALARPRSEARARGM